MLRAMLVDDFDFYRNEIKAMEIWGETSGFTVAAEASSGRGALDILRAQPVDLLVTDIRMPFIDGIELTKTAMDEKLCKCVILMSQFNDFEYARKGILYGAFEYLLKPVDESELLKSLRRASAYIIERNKELVKINYADHVLDNSAHEYYPFEDLKLLLRSIGHSDADSAKIASKIVETVWSETDFDMLKSSYIIQKVRRDLAEAIHKAYPWIEKITGPVDGESSDFLPSLDIESLKESFIDFVDHLKETVLRFELNTAGSGIIRIACRHILENIDEKLSLKALSKQLFISSSYLSQLFKVKTGMNLIDYITSVKMERAKRLLSDDSLKIYEVAAKLGMSMEYFSKLFKKTNKVSPTRYRSIIFQNKTK